MLSLAELHARHPYDREERYWNSSVSFEDCIAQGNELHLQENPFEYLNDLDNDKDGRIKAIDINKSLLYLPPEVVVDNFGIEVGLWSSLTSCIMGDNVPMNTLLGEKYGIDTKDLEIARGWDWRRNRGPGSHTTKTILAQYGLMEALKQGVLDSIDLPSLIRENAQEGVEISDTRARDYSLVPIETSEYNSYYDGGPIKGWELDTEKRIGYDSWLDTPSGFALMYKGAPNAMAGIVMHGQDEIMLHQIQGVQAKRIDPTKFYLDKDYIVGTVSSRGLAPIDWQKLLVDATERIAISRGASLVGIQAAINNVWIKKRMSRDTEPHLPLVKAEVAYDYTAWRLGYTRDPENEKDNWHKKVA